MVTSNSGSWILIEKSTGKAVCEIFSFELAKIVNTEKYEALDAVDYLAGLNQKNKADAA